MSLSGGLNQQSAIRTINRGMEQHKRYFGADSREYQDLLNEMERLLGKPDYTQKNGAAGYSRGKGKSYSDDRLIMAKDLVTGNNTAAAKWSRKQLYLAGAEPEDDEIEWKELEDEVSKHYKSIYNLFKDTTEDFESSEIIKKFAGVVDDKSELVENLRQNFVRNPKELKDLIERAKKHRENIENGLRESETGLRRTRKLTQKEAQQLNKRR